MEYNHIVNPMSGKKVNLFGNQGKKIINNYLNILQHGGNGCNGLRKAPCIKHKECEWGMPTGKKPNRCYVPKSDEPGAVNPATAPVLVKPTISRKTKKYGTTTPQIKPTSNQCKEVTSENGFTPSQVKKYQNRPSPPYPATDCAGKLMLGQGKGASTMYESVPRGKSYVWVKAKIKPAVQPLRVEKTTPVKDKIHKYYFTGKIELVRLVNDPTVPDPSINEIYNYMSGWRHQQLVENLIYRGLMFRRLQYFLFDDIKDINITPDLTLSFTLWVIENSKKTKLRKAQFGKDVPTAEQVVQFLADEVNSFPDGCYEGDTDNECHYPMPDDMDAHMRLLDERAGAAPLAEITIENLDIKKTKPSTKTAVQPLREEKTTPVKDKIHKYYFTGKIELVRLVNDPTVPDPSINEIYNYMSGWRHQQLVENLIYRGLMFRRLQYFLFDDIKDINITPDLTLSFTLWVIENSKKTKLRKAQFGKDVPTAEQVVQFLADEVNSFPYGCYEGDIENECHYPMPNHMKALAEITIENLNIKKTKPSTKKAGTTALPKKPLTIKPTKKPVAAKPVKKSVVTKSPKKTIAAKTKTDKPKINKPESADCIEATLENGFTPSQVKKYQGRPSPPYPAANCTGEEMYGQGKGQNTLYRSVPRGKSYAWAKV